jgi:hypothetical protein
MTESGGGGHPDSGSDTGSTGMNMEAGSDAPSVPLTTQIGAPAPPGMDIVTGGGVLKSTSYTLYSTVGEGPGGNGVMSSAKYKMTAGLLGTTQP